MTEEVYQANLKWGKQLLPISIDVNEESMIFKAQVFALTSVQPERQKLILKGGRSITDTTDMKALGLRDGEVIMLIGTPDDKQVTVDLSKKAIFAEDLTSSDKARLFHQKTGDSIPVGLRNLGNTCYMNSCIQVLKKAKELTEDIKQFKGLVTNPNKKPAFIAALRDTYQMLETTGEPVRPLNLVVTLKQAFPLFDEVDEQGHPKQQDAEECWANILTTLQMYHSTDLIKRLFEIEFIASMKNAEAPEEAPSTSVESALKLSCHIDNESNPISYLQDGLRVSLTGSLTKFSPTLNRDAVYMKNLQIKKLPGYLCVHFVRFFWKQANVSAGTRAGKAKILRNVAFPRILDMYEFCSPDLQKELAVGRAEETRQLEEETKRMIENKEKGAEDEAKPLLSKEEKKEDLLINDEILNMPFGTGMDTGKYHLVGVVTHKGRYADSGHYVGWTYHKQNTWLKYDDDVVSTVKTQDILALRGGGDWHTAYLCLYRKQQVVPRPESPKARPMTDVKP